MTDALSRIRTRNTVTPQSEQSDSRQVKNSAGGFTFEVSGEDRIKRFLMLGTDGGSFYAKERDLTQENADVVIDWAKNHGVRLAYLLLDISENGRAPRQNPTLFALAAIFAFGNSEARKSAQEVFNRIVRTGTHLFIFVKYAEQFRGWGRGFRKAVGNWYLDKDVNDLSYQLVKYRQRENWTHRDILRKAHPHTADTEKNALLRWAVNGGGDTGVYYTDGRPIFYGWTLPYEVAQNFGKMPAASKSCYADIIREHPGTPWEALPDVALTYPETWEALLDNGMPMTALIRNLSKLTRMGVLTGARLRRVCEQISSPDNLRKARVHPVKLLYALRTYAQGRSAQGASSWAPNQAVIDALDAAFYASFKTVEPAGKRTGVFLDVSASMTWDSSRCGILTAREASAAMAMVTAASEPFTEIAAFSCGGSFQRSSRYGYGTGIERIPLSPRRRLDDNLMTISGLHAGGTDCALPMLWAKHEHIELDTFVIYTDNETWAGAMHPHEALREYRQATGINARLIVAGMASNGFTVADPADPLQMDVCGFDADTPSVISGFSRGDFG